MDGESWAACLHPRDQETEACVIKMNEMDFPGNLVLRTATATPTPPRVSATSNSGDMGSIPDWETKVPHDIGCGQKIF